MIRNYVRKTERQCWSEGAMRRAVKETEEHKAELLLYFDIFSIQKRPCNVHDEQNLKKEALPKVDEEIKSVCNVAQPLTIRMRQHVCIAMNYALCQPKFGYVLGPVENGHIYLAEKTWKV
jgi:hypothetical protein